MLNVVDGCIPSDMATGSAEEIEEERRLLYVAMTRAKDQLHADRAAALLRARQARRGDKHLYASRTRFIPAQIAGHFEMRSWPAAGRGPQAAGDERRPPSIGARMRGMWRGTGT